MSTKKATTKKSKTSKAKKATTKRQTSAAPRATAAKAKGRPIDKSRPATGSVLHRSYKGQEIEVRVLPDGYEYAGETFRSLTALALKLTGYKAISGPVWFRSAKPIAEAK